MSVALVVGVIAGLMLVMAYTLAKKRRGM